MTTYLYTLAAGAQLPAPQRRQLFGGKGAALVEMAEIIGLRVPRAVILSTEAGQFFLQHGLTAPLRGAIDAAVAHMENAENQHFGAADKPLIVSVRSAGYHSMPGMMDTILNVGITAAHCRAAASVEIAAHRLECLALMLSGLLAANPRADAETAAICARIKQIGAAAHAITAADDIEPVLAQLQAQADRAGQSTLLDNAADQLTASVSAVFASWNSHRATVYREREQLSHTGGTAAIIQCMVFGNRNQRSGTGVVFSRDPNSGAAVAYGDFARCAQGEAVVSGASADTVGIATMHDHFPQQYRDLQSALIQLERHYRDMVDVEFTIDDAELWILQARPGKRSSVAALRIAHDLARAETIALTPAEIRIHLERADLPRLAAGTAVTTGAMPLATGMGVSAGFACGAIYMTQEDAEAAVERDEQILYVRPETAPDDVPIMAVAAGVMTAIGGAASHAAVIARAWGKPTVVGVAGLTCAEEFILLGDTRIERGERLTIDGASGAVYRGEIDIDRSVDTEVETLVAWARQYLP